jgi:SEC-C motif-containing protein
VGVNDKCPCGSGLKYKKCCKTYHDGRVAKTALLLMKSRYSAYALGNAKYIQNSAENQDDIESIKEFSKNTTFKKLDILNFEDGENEAFVTFRATLFNQTIDISFTEKSRFLKKDGRWYYIDGVISEV